MASRFRRDKAIGHRRPAQLRDRSLHPLRSLPVHLANALGSLPCDIYYLGKYAIVGSLDGPDRSKGAPIYILENDRLVSTMMPKEDLGLENFKHVHNAVLREYNNKLYIIAQAWNPGDFAILEQVTN